MSDRAADLFIACEQAIRSNILIERPSQTDKEFAVQNWVADRLESLGLPYAQNGRNRYPDFILSEEPVGFEVKSLAVPGREASFDANSQVPAGHHHGRDIYYVFIRYPAGLEAFPVHDLVICHGDFLNPTCDYVHRNDNIPNFGGYGDIMIRDRKMYVVRTPYDVADGLSGKRTLILNADRAIPRGLRAIAELERVEAREVATAYTFDLLGGEMKITTSPNEYADTVHRFVAYRSERGDAAISVRAGGPRRRVRRV